MFKFLEDSCNREGVQTLCVFKPEVVRGPVQDEAHGEVESFVGKVRVSGGQLQQIAYSSWLKFFSPLSHSVQMVNA
jgi:hypothetical protein